MIKLYRIVKLTPGREVVATVACERISSDGHHYKLRHGGKNEIVATMRITQEFVIEEVGTAAKAGGI